MAMLKAIKKASSIDDEESKSTKKLKVVSKATITPVETSNTSTVNDIINDAGQTRNASELSSFVNKKYSTSQLKEALTKTLAQSKTAKENVKQNALTKGIALGDSRDLSTTFADVAKQEYSTPKLVVGKTSQKGTSISDVAKEAVKQTETFKNEIATSKDYKKYYQTEYKTAPLIQYGIATNETEATTINTANKIFSTLLGGISSGLGMDGKKYQLENGGQVSLPNKLELVGQKTQQSYTSKFGQLYGQITNVIGSEVPVILATATGIPGLSQVAMFGSASSQTYNQQLLEGRDPKQAGLYAIIDGALETGLGTVLGGLGTGGKQIAQKSVLKLPVIKQIATSITEKIATKPLLQTGLRLLGSSMGEGTEEYLQQILTPVMANVAYNENNKFLTADNLFSSEAKTSFLLGFLGDVVVSGPQYLAKGLSPKQSGQQFLQDNAEKIVDQYNVAQVNEINENKTNLQQYSQKVNDLKQTIQQSSDPIEIMDATMAVQATEQYVSELQDQIKNQKFEEITPDVLKVVPQNETKVQNVLTVKQNTEIKTSDGQSIVFNRFHPDAKNISSDYDYSTSKSSQKTGYGIALTNDSKYISGKSEDDIIKTTLITKKGMLQNNGQQINETDVNTLNQIANKYMKNDENYFGTGSISSDDLIQTINSVSEFISSEYDNATARKAWVDFYDAIGKDGYIKKEADGSLLAVVVNANQLKYYNDLQKVKTVDNSLDTFEGSKSDIEKIDNIQDVKTSEVIEGSADQQLVNKILSNSSKTEKPKSTFKSGKDYITSKIFNNTKIIDDIAKQTKNTQLAAVNDRRFSASNISAISVMTNQVDLKGNVVGPSVDSILKPFEKDQNVNNLFNAYVYLKSNLERQANGKDSFGNEVSEKAAREYIAKMNVSHPEFKQGQSQIRQYYKNLLQNEVNSGRVSVELAEYLNNKYQDYARFYVEQQNTITYKNDKVVVAPPVKVSKGGKNKILPLRESLVKATYGSYSGTLDNNLRLELLNTLGGTKLAVDKNYKPILDLGNDKYMVVAYKNGVPYGIEANEDLVKAMNISTITEGEKKLASFLNPLKKIGEIRRDVLVDYDIFFSLYRNPIKDIQDAVVNSKHAASMSKNYIPAIKSIISNDIGYQEYKNQGGISSSYFDVDGKPMNKLKQRITNMNQMFEQAPRYAEYIASLQAGDSVESALYNAAEVTTNFKRGGVWTKTLNRNGATFLNASVQGFYKQYKNLTGQNGVKGYVNLLSKVVALGIVPGIANALIYTDDDDYNDLPDYIKDSYYVIKTGDNTFLKIPKGRVLSIFNSAARRTIETIQTETNQFEGLLKFAYQQAGPNNPLDENVLSPIVQAISNTKWTGDSIDSYYESDPNSSSYKQPKDRVTGKTTEIAKFIGELFNVSPKRIDYVIDQYAGEYYKFAKPLITPAEENNPIASQFLIDTVYTNSSVNDLYKLRSQYSDSEDDKLIKSRLNSVLYDINNMYGEIKDIELSDSTTKKQQVRDLSIKINNTANNAEGDYKVQTTTINNVKYKIVGDKKDGYIYKKNKNGEWTKISSNAEKFYFGVK